MEESIEKKENKIRITLQECVTGDLFTFPILPEEINVECKNRFQSYSILNIGEVKVAQGEELTRFSWKCILPGNYFNPMRELTNDYTIVEHTPQEIEEYFSYLRNSNIKCRLTVAETPINHTVYLESYHMIYAGGYGDYQCDISFIHAKELKIYREGAGGSEAGGSQQQAAKAQPVRPSDTNLSYTVAKNDCLWNIAQSKLGSGSRYGEIAALNGISDPSKIYIGQVLLLPQA